MSVFGTSRSLYIPPSAVDAWSFITLSVLASYHIGDKLTSIVDSHTVRVVPALSRHSPGRLKMFCDAIWCLFLPPPTRQLGRTDLSIFMPAMTSGEYCIQVLLYCIKVLLLLVLLYCIVWYGCHYMHEINIYFHIPIKTMIILCFVWVSGSACVRLIHIFEIKWIRLWWVVFDGTVVHQDLVYCLV